MIITGNFMDAHADKPHNSNDIARLALAMHDHSYFFSLRRHLYINFSRDLNGSGTQGLFIKKQNDETDLIQVIFGPTYSNDGDFLYEADLFTDQRKDYEPTVNRGKHRFVAKRADLKIDWNSDVIHKWRSDIERLTRPHDTLDDWLKNESEMLVRCTAIFFCRKPAILTLDDLKRYVAMGFTLEDLKTRLKCSKCGKRGAKITAF